MGEYAQTRFHVILPHTPGNAPGHRLFLLSDAPKTRLKQNPTDRKNSRRTLLELAESGDEIVEDMLAEE